MGAHVRIELEFQTEASNDMAMHLARVAAEAGKNGTGRPVTVVSAEVVAPKKEKARA